MTEISTIIRQYGLQSYISWKRHVSSNLFSSVDISSTVVAQPEKSSPVNCLHLEKIETRYILAGYGNGTIAILDSFQSNNSKRIPIIADVNMPMYSVDDVQWYPRDTGMFLSLSADKTINIWDTNEMQVVDRFKFQSDVLSFDIRSNGNSLVAVTCRDKNIYLCDLNSGSKSHTLTGHKKSVFVAKWSPRKECLLATAGSDGSINVWDVRKSNALLISLTSQKINGQLAHNGVVNSLCFTSDGLKLLSYGHDDAVRIWNMWDYKEICEINYGTVKNETGRKVQMAVTCCMKEELLFIPTVCNVEVFKINTGVYVKTLSGHFKNVNCVCYCNERQVLYTGSADNKILQWNFQRSNQDEEYLAGEYHQDTWSDDGS